MAAENVSPEERLFKIIQEGKNEPLKITGPAPDKIDSVPDRVIPAPDKINLVPDKPDRVEKAAEKPGPGGVKNLFGRPKPAAKPDGSPAAGGILDGLHIKLQKVDPKTINIVLAVIVIAFAILVVYYAMTKSYNITNITGAVSGTPAQLGPGRTIEDFAPEQSYIDEVKKRDIFRPEGSNVKAPVVKSALRDMIKDISLAGIYQGVYPEAMIEDKTAKKTYFLKEGDEIRGVTIKSIQKDKVILRYGEEEIEIF